MPVYKDENKKSKKGQWYVSVRYKDWQGQNKLKKKRGFDTQREAKDWERKFLQQCKTDLNMTMSSFYEMYETDKRPQVKESTWRTKEAIVRAKILPYFGEKKMSEITPRDVIKWQNTMRKQKDKNGNLFSPVYLKTLHNQLSAIFNHAIQYYDMLFGSVKKKDFSG